MPVCRSFDFISLGFRSDGLFSFSHKHMCSEECVSLSWLLCISAVGEFRKLSGSQGISPGEVSVFFTSLLSVIYSRRKSQEEEEEKEKEEEET